MRQPPRSARERPDQPLAPVDHRPRFDGICVDRLPDPLPQVRRGRRRPVKVFGDEFLALPCQDVTTFASAGLRAIVDDMFATMAATDEPGLAANQIGVGLSVIVFHCADAWGIRHVGHLINPVVETADTGQASADTERCLSVPGCSAPVARSDSVWVRGQDLMGKPVFIAATGALSRCLQHETDHLRGLSYLDRLSSPERQRILGDLTRARPRRRR